MNQDDKYLGELGVLVDRARESFLAFVLLMHPPGAGSIVLGKLHKYLIAQVQRELTGKGTGRLAVSVPPQHGKSTFLSILAAAWHLGRFPGKSVAITGALGSLIHDFSKKIRAIVADPKYALVFPKARIVFGSNRAEHWKLTNGSELVAKAAGSKLTGRRVDWLIIDDPHRGREEAESSLQRGRVREWYFADCYTRLAPTAKIFLIGTRFHPEDLIGTLTNDDYAEEMRNLSQPQEIFCKVVIEALCEHPQRDPIGREFGEALSPELGRTREFLLAAKATLPHYEWQSQFQGAPQTKVSGQVDVAKINLIQWKDIPKDTVFTRGWDLALTEKESSDFSAGAKCGFHKATGNFYICDMFRKQLLWGGLKKQIVSLALADTKDDAGSVMTMGVENVGGFDVAYRELKQSSLLGRVSVRPVTSNKSKLVRAGGWFNLIEAGKVFMVQAPWNKDFISELAQFPDGEHDDQCLTNATYILHSSNSLSESCSWTRIDKIRAGDRVMTRKGLRKVLWAGKTGRKVVIERYGLTGTPNHPVWTENRGWIPMQSLKASDELVVGGNQYGLTGDGTIDTLTQPDVRTPSIFMLIQGGRKVPDPCTGMFTRSILGLFEQAGTCITNLALTITGQRALKYALPCNMGRSTGKKVLHGQHCTIGETEYRKQSQLRREKQSWKHRKPLLELDTRQRKKSILQRIMACFCAKPDAAQSLETHHTGSIESAGRVLSARDTPNGISQEGLPLWYVSSAEKFLKMQRTDPVFVLPHAVESQCLDGSEQDVYNLRVESEPEFFANGILVHNCDAVTVAFDVLGVKRRKKLLFA